MIGDIKVLTGRANIHEDTTVTAAAFMLHSWIVSLGCLSFLNFSDKIQGSFFAQFICFEV